jgi:hypothetical protein
VTLAPEHYYSVIAGLDPVIYNSLFRNNFLRRDGSQAWERKMPYERGHDGVDGP